MADRSPSSDLSGDEADEETIDPEDRSTDNKFLGRLARRFPAGSFARNATSLSLAIGFGQLIIVGSSPIVTRLYEPSALGLLAVFVAIVSTLSPISSLNYQVAIPLPEDERLGADLLWLSFWIAVAFSIAIGILALILGKPLLDLVNASAMQPFLWLLPISLLGASMYRTLSFWGIRIGAYNRIARTQITQSIGQVGTQIGLGALGVGPVGLLVGDSIGRSAGSGLLAATALRRDRELLKRVSWKGMKEAAIRYKRFPILSTGSLLANNAGQNLPPLLVAATLGTQVTGWFGLGQRVIAVPVRTIGQAVAQVYIGRAAELARSDLSRLKRLFRSTTKRLFLVGLVPAGIVAITGGVLFPAVFGAGWREAGVFAQILSVSFVFQLVAVPVSQTLNVIERQDLQLGWDLLRVLLVVLSFLVPSALGASARTTIAVYAIGTTISYAMLVGLTYIALSRAEVKT